MADTPSCAWIVSLAGGTPADLPTRLAAAGWTVEHHAPVEILSVRVPSRVGLFVWVDDTWERGLELLAQMASPITRASTVLVGRTRPRGLGQEIRARGGLTWWAVPLASWILPPIQEAIARLAGQLYSYTDALARKIGEGLGRSPEAVVVGVAASLREILGADLALAAVQPPGKGDFHYLRDDRSGIQPAKWQANECDWNPPQNLCQTAWLNQQTKVVPDIEHAHQVVPYPEGQPYRASVATPLPLDDASRMSLAPAVLALYWREPRVLHTFELDLIRSFACVAGAAWVRTGVRDYADQAHGATRKALLSLPWMEGTRPTDTGVSSVTADEIISDYLEAAQGWQGLLGLWVWVRLSGGKEPVWSRLRDLAVPASVTAAVPPVGGRLPDPISRPEGAGSWLVIEPIRAETAGLPEGLIADLPDLGGIAALFEDSAASADGLRDVARLSRDLSLILHLHRRAMDDLVAARVARQLAHATDAQDALQNIAQTLQAHVGATGVKVFVLVRDRGMLSIQQIYRTGMGGRRSVKVPFTKERGLAGRVLSGSTWWYARHPAGVSDATPSLVWSGDGTETTVLPVPADAYFPEKPPPDDEENQILVPLLHNGKPAGVLAVWRKEEPNFNAALDVESLLRLAPHVASACSRIATAEAVNEQAKATEGLTQDINVQDSPSHALRRSLRRILELSLGAHAVLLRADPNRRGRFFYAVSWSYEQEATRELDAIRDMNLDLGPDAREWRGRAQTFLEQRHVPGHTPRTVLQLSEQRHAVPWALVAILDRESMAEKSTFDPIFRMKVIESFSGFVGSMIPNFVRAAALNASRALRPAATGDEDYKNVLERAANVAATLEKEKEKQKFHAAALVYYGEGPDLRLMAVYPPNDKVKVLPDGKHSLARHAMRERQPMLVSDLSDREEALLAKVDMTALRAISAAFGWKEVRSLLACPLVYRDRSFGVIKLVTPSPGPFLTEDHRTVVQAVAERAAEEAERARHADAVRGLNQIANKLAGKQGDELAQAVIQEFERWGSDHFGRAVKVALVTRVGSGSIILQRASRGIDLGWVSHYSEDLKSRGARWPVAGIPSPEGAPMQGALVEPLALASRPDLIGHLFLFSEVAWTDRDAELAHEAARELSVIVHGEVLVDEWRFYEGLVRHAFLAPVQGLQSAAEVLAEIAEAADTEPEATKDALRQVREEVAVLRTWRETLSHLAPLRQGRSLDITHREVAFANLVAQCFERYKALFKGRGIKAELKLPLGDITLKRADPHLLDIALSNLLDNAFKYGFYNREVTLELSVGEKYVVVRVTDIGHGIPEDKALAIYIPHGRVAKGDTLRSIQGEGLGLYLVKEIAKAHGGDLMHTSEPEHRSRHPEGDTTPFRVSFTINIPHGWPRRTSSPSGVGAKS